MRALRRRWRQISPPDELHPGLGLPRRQGQAPPFHGQGDRRAAGSRRPYACRICRFRRAGGRGCRRSSRFDFANLDRLTITACGTAYLAGLVAKYWFERYARLPTEVDIASEFRYREAPLPKNGLAIVISQSGETADTLAALRYCKAQGQHTLAIVNVPEFDHRARMPKRPSAPMPALRSASPRPRRSPASSPCLPRSPSPPARRGASSRRSRSAN